MVELIQNQWVQRAGVAVVAALLGVVVAGVIFSGGPTDPGLGPVKLTTGGTVFLTGDGGRTGASREVLEAELPFTGADAVAAGWKDPFLCDQGRGKYFEKDAGEGTPYILMYNSADDLIGIYLISETEMPAPWERTEEILGGAGPVIEYEHWGMFIYFQDPTQACTITQSSVSYR